MKASAFVVPSLAALLLLGACSEPSNTQVLQTRVAITRSSAVSCNQSATIQNLPDGARVLIADTSLFIIGRADLSDCGRFALGNVVEAMLNPRIMQVVVEPGGDLDAPESLLLRERATTVQAFLTNAGFTGTQPPVLVQPAVDRSRNWGIVLAVADHR